MFVVPGDIYRETSQGCNSLLSQGVAKAVQCANDILSEYGIKSVQSKLSLLETMDLSDRQQAVLDCLG
ncbi:MAG: hypothetical protein U9Q15_03705 [Patescibacteria group bacterium]|nr:hypothetical protein [Patescibacteria group bacterium]